MQRKMNRLTPIYIFTLAVIPSVFSFSWEDCGTAGNAIKIRKLYVTDNRDLFYVSFDGKVGKNITEPVEAKLRIQKKLPIINTYVDIPCVDNVGSCDYSDVCKMSPWQDKDCPPEFFKNNIPCKCPLLQNDYSAKQLAINLRKYAAILEGTYKLRLLLQKGSEELLCLSLKISI